MRKLDIQGMLIHKQIFFTVMGVVFNVSFKILSIGWVSGVASEKRERGCSLPDTASSKQLQRTIRHSGAPWAGGMVPWRMHT